MIANMLVNTGIVMVVLCMNKFDPCWICVLEERLTSVCVKGGNLICRRCAVVKRMIPMFSKDI